METQRIAYVSQGKHHPDSVPGYIEEHLLCDRLILLTPLLFPETLTREGFFGTTTLARLHVVAVLLDFFDDVFRLHLTLEAPESVFQRLTLLNNNFGHAYSPPSPVRFFGFTL